ncbi:choice-of-anchor M domain-containing protein [Occultella glacieicola]|uniref:choice-of-anchor M domain-containing protein n=1 Tax=Occultella glacieicola TaxID=2518684 RepID=UPI00140539E1|nr:choice-of-anchor M domain-containing protein [Occultella glacieicola]
MTARSPGRREAALATTLAVGFSALLLPAPSAAAAEGPAPEPSEYQVVSGVHTDVAATFLDEGRLTLAAKADLPGATGTRLDPDEVWFHLEDDARVVLPGDYGFIAPAGTDVWLAPESNPGADRLWPGFNTESIDRGTIDADVTTFTLTSIEGPGELEVFAGGGIGTIERLWSSQDAAIRSFDIGWTHKHANWAFTQAGTYTLGVEATASINGVAQSSSASYTFVVGDAPRAVATTTTLTASTIDLTTGDPLTLTATIEPADTEGHVEFHSGTTVLGHESVVEGSAVFATSAPAVGRHSLTAVFVPAVANNAGTSRSQPLTVTVTDDSGVGFGIAGIQETYRVGDHLEARVVGHTLGEGQVYQWHWRPVGAESAYVITGGGQEAAGRLRVALDASYDDYEVSVVIRENSAVVTRSAWVPLVVGSDDDPIGGSFLEGDSYLGDPIAFTLDRPATAGETVRLAYRFETGPWNSAADISTQIDATTLHVHPTNALNGPSWVVQTLRDGVVVAQSESVTKSILAREVNVQGFQPVYRVGQTMSLSAEVYPALEGASYLWQLIKWNSETSTLDRVTLKEGPGPDNLRVELPLEASHDGWQLAFEVSPAAGSSYDSIVGWHYATLAVSDIDPDTQLFYLEGLAGHYHQGGDVNLTLVADPALARGDTIAWEWLWPGSQAWSALPDASGLSHVLVAEQALDGVQIRATLTFSGGTETLVAEPVAIEVDDHGAAPIQVVTVTGDVVADGSATVSEGDAVSLTAAVANGTVLDAFQWFVKEPGATAPAPINGATSATYEFTATLAHGGAELSVALVKPDGTPAYGPSAPVTLQVEESGEEPPPSGKPSEAPSDRSPADLGETPAGGIALDATSVAPGDFLRLGLGDAHAEAWVAAWLFSGPTLLGGDWLRATAAGSVTVQVPSDATAGEHRLAVFTSDGALIGWAELTVTGGGDGTGGSTGDDTDSGTGADTGDRDAGTDDGTPVLATTGSSVHAAALTVALVLALAGAALLAVGRRRWSSTR